MTNVLVYMADNLSGEIMRAAMPYTNGTFRNLGCLYPRFYNPVPECTPARASLMTGQYPHNNGVFVNTDLVTNESTDSLAPWLTSSVNCATWGKQYNFNLTEESRPGFDHMRLLSQTWPEPYGYGIWNGSSESFPSGHMMHYFTSEVVTWIEAGPTEPFFAWVAPPMPHVKTSGTFPSKPTNDHGNKFWTNHPDIPFLTDTTDKPSWIAAEDAADSSVKDQIRTHWKLQCRSARDCDTQFQAIVEALQAEDLFDDTVVIFVSDNGIMFGRQRLSYPFGVYLSINQSALYEPLINIPAIAVGPGFTAGSTEDALVMMADVTATTLDVLNKSATITLDGQSLLDPIDPDRQLLCAVRDSDVCPDADGIISPDDKLIRYADTGTDEFELYDLVNDPDELVNRAFAGGSWLTLRNTREAELDALLP